MGKDSCLFQCFSFSSHNSPLDSEKILSGIDLVILQALSLNYCQTALLNPGMISLNSQRFINGFKR
ncbi:hypothetical protein RintRC_3436 [Richelia intracellularis]|nr:hypothetical protein RintRC_3436 [Richelia intracellularis]